MANPTHIYNDDYWGFLAHNNQPCAIVTQDDELALVQFEDGLRVTAPMRTLIELKGI